MDEEDNNQEQNAQEKIQDAVKDTEQGVKDGANLAKNAASGNYLGAAKDAVNLMKNKTVRKKMIIKTALSILAPILFIVIVASVVLGVFNAVGDGIQSVIKSIGEFFTVDLSNDLEIKITDEALDAMIESIESMGISLDDLHLMGDAADYNDPEVEEKNKEALRKYLREFYEAQAVTQTLYPSPEWYQKIGDKTYGTVYLQRVKEDDTDLSKVTKLKYIPYDEMKSKQTEGTSETNTTTNLDNLLFIGDSRTVGAESKLEGLGENIGVSAVSSSKPSDWKNITSTGGTGTVLDTTVTLTPSSSVKGISVALGVNGAGYQIDSMKEILENLLALYPDVPIFVNEVFKVGKDYSYGSTTASSFNITINKFNSELQEYCNTNSRLVYISISSGLYDSEGYLKSEYTSDSLHLNDAGNEVLVQNIKNAILNSGMVEGNSTDQNTPTNSQIEDIMKYFSINPENGKLVIANTTVTTVKVNGSQTKNETVIGLTEIDYKSVISQYTTSMNFLVYLTIVTQNPEFAVAVADLVKDSDIRITIMDKVSTTTTNEVRNYTVNTKTIEKVASGVAYDSWDTEKKYPHTTYTYVPSYGEPQKKTDTTETTIVSTIPVPAVNYAKTWFSEQTIEYNKTNTTMQESSFTTEPNNEEEPSISGEGSSATWITDDVTTITTKGNVSQYEEVKRGDVIDRVGEKGDGKKSFVGLLDVEFKIPNSKQKEAAGGNLVSGAEIFFYLLQKDSSSQNLENIVRYALYKYTGNSYGVTSLDLSVFDIKTFSTVSGISGGSTEEKVWFALLNAGYSKYAAAGVMGNIYGESGFASNNLENSSNTKSGLSDEQFTEMVNNGQISRTEFISCEKYSTYSNQGWIYGYGLAQWTSQGRKSGLYDFAKSRGVSIDDEDMQIEYIVKEITGTGADGFGSCQLSAYKGFTVSDWTDATSASAAAEAFCWIFEKPSAWNPIRATKAEEYYEKYKDLDAGGSYSEGSSEYGVNGYYTSSRGRTFTILNQTKITGWGESCNRAACAIIASGYSDETSTELIASINSASMGLYGAIPADGSSYWEKYGLKVTYTEDNTNDYTEKLKNQLRSGGYALIWINNNKSNYYGKSGIKWTSLYHWLAIIDYKEENGVEKMCIADWRGITWVELDEFTTHGITHLIFINEK